MGPQKVIVRFLDGRILKGHTNSFSPQSPSFTLEPPAGQPGELTTVEVGMLKAIFFVKDFSGRKGYEEKKDFANVGVQPGKKLKVAFKDGETIVGTTAAYDPKAVGFFMTPIDPNSNTIKLFALNAAISNVRIF